MQHPSTYETCHVCSMHANCRSNQSTYPPWNPWLWLLNTRNKLRTLASWASRPGRPRVKSVSWTQRWICMHVHLPWPPSCHNSPAPARQLDQSVRSACVGPCRSYRLPCALALALPWPSRLSLRINSPCSVRDIPIPRPRPLAPCILTALNPRRRRRAKRSAHCHRPAAYVDDDDDHPGETLALIMGWAGPGRPGTRAAAAGGRRHQHGRAAAIGCHARRSRGCCARAGLPSA